MSYKLTASGKALFQLWQNKTTHFYNITENRNPSKTGKLGLGTLVEP